METPIALHSVAHRVSHQILAESEMSRQNRAAPPPPQKSRCRTFLWTPQSHFPVSFEAGKGPGGGVTAGRGCRGVLVEGIAALWVPKTDRATGGCRNYNHTSHATLCNLPGITHHDDPKRKEPESAPLSFLELEFVGFCDTLSLSLS